MCHGTLDLTDGQVVAFSRDGWHKTNCCVRGIEAEAVERDGFYTFGAGAFLYSLGKFSLCVNGTCVCLGEMWHAQW